jgi:hypothetical protein
VPRHRSGRLRGVAASGLAVVLLALGGLAPAHAETTGTLLDPGFSARVAEGFGGTAIAERDTLVYDIAPMPDGGYVVAGAFTTYQGQPASGLARLTPDLELDRAFTARLGTGFGGYPVLAVAPMPDGSLVVGLGITATFHGKRLQGLARLTPELELDTAFESDLGDGIGYMGGVFDVYPMPDGGFVLSGNFFRFRGQPTPGGFIRVDDRLQLDADFAAAVGDGFAGGRGGAGADSVAALPDGGWLVGGSFTRYQGKAARYLVRLTPELELAVEDAPATPGNRVTEVVALPDGGALVAGDFPQFGGQQLGDVIWLDERMQVSPATPFDTEGLSLIRAIVPQADGGYLFGGRAHVMADGQEFPALGRFVAATVALEPVPDRSGYAGLPGAEVRLAATRAPAWLPEVTYSATGLPAGVTVDAATGRITGTPTVAGTYVLELAAHLGTVTDVTTTTWEVLPSSPPVLSGGPTGAVVGTPYRFQPEVAGAPAPTVTLGAGALPDGLTLDASTGLVSGTPTTPGEYRFTLVATNGIGPGATAFEVTIDVLGPPQVAVARAEVVAGQEQSVTGSGFVPGERVAVEMASDPVDLGTVTADAAGTIALTFTVPAATPPGTHTVTATGRGGAGVATFAVVEEAVAEPPADEPDDALAVTGAAVGPVVGAVAALLGVGLVLALGAGSVRRRAAEG